MTLYLILVIGLIAFFTCMIYLPGRSYRGGVTRTGACRRRRPRCCAVQPPQDRNDIEQEALAAVRADIAAQFEAAGYAVRHQEYQISGDRCAYLEVIRPGSTRPDEIVIVGVHYEAVIGAPGANETARAWPPCSSSRLGSKMGDFPARFAWSPLSTKRRHISCRKPWGVVCMPARLCRKSKRSDHVLLKAVSNVITSQLIRHNFPWFALTLAQQSPEKPFGGH